MKPEDIRVIFSDVEIIYNANVKLLKELDQKLAQWSSATQIGPVFLEMVGLCCQ